MSLFADRKAAMVGASAEKHSKCNSACIENWVVQELKSCN